MTLILFFFFLSFFLGRAISFPWMSCQLIAGLYLSIVGVWYLAKGYLGSEGVLAPHSHTQSLSILEFAALGLSE